MRINEIFDSLSGECDGFGGQGKPATFIRLQGCNMPRGCSYCDIVQTHQHEAGTEMTIEEILSQVNMLKVIITGGEPLAQYNDVAELVRRLFNLHHPTTIETNGSIQVHHQFPDMYGREKWLRIVMDYKLPSSGMEQYMDMTAFKFLRSWDVIKFVIGDDVDYARMKELLADEETTWDVQIAISPMLDDTGLDGAQGYERARKLAQAMLTDSDLLLKDVRFNLQIHKLLGIK